MNYSPIFARISLFFVTLIVSADIHAAVRLERIWTHDAGGSARAEIVAYDEAAEEFLTVDGDQRCVVRLDVGTGRELGRFDVSAWGDPTSVAASHGLVAVAVVASTSTEPGHIILFPSAKAPANDKIRTTNDQRHQRKSSSAVRVGAMPDMVTFTPDGRYILAANEGEPCDDYRVDPEGSISVIDVGLGPEHAAVLSADFAAFNSRRDELEQLGVRIMAPNPHLPDGRATVAQDLEPEYIAVAPDGHTAWVTLQENNSLAIVDIRTALVRDIVPLGRRDHSRVGLGFDASDRDGGIHIRRWPVWGMYMPDSIAAIDVDGATYIVTANEGESRGYSGFSDHARVESLTLDASLLDAEPDLQDDDRLGRLIVSRVGGDTDGDGDVDQLLGFGTRSMSIWSAGGELVYDSGDAIEQFVAEHLPERFNIEGDGEGTVDVRSPEKGPEPEGIAVGRVGDSVYAFVGLERTSAVAIFEIRRPASARLIDVVPLALDDLSDGRPHIAPEGLTFVPAERSPTGAPLLAVACEVTGTTILFRVREAR